MNETNQTQKRLRNGEKPLEIISAVATNRLIRKGDMSIRDVLEHSIKRYQENEEKINAWIDFQPLRNEAATDLIQHKMRTGELDSPLAGIPVAMKDNICTKGVRTTCGSGILRDFSPPYSAHVVDLLEKQGMIMAGKTNMDEFAMGNTSETSAFGAVRNPWDLTRSPGGSSGGSAAAIASGMIPIALGSDTGGSVRQPAACCGISGLKPTYGTVSRYGLIAYASSLDQIGPMAVFTEDLAALLDAIKGKDTRDATQISHRTTGHLDHLTRRMKIAEGESRPLKDIRIAVLKDAGNKAVKEDVQRSIRILTDRLTEMGASCELIDLPMADYLVPTYYIIACAEAASNLARYDGIKYTRRSASAESLHDIYAKTRTEFFGTEVIRRILLGSFVLSTGYFDAYYRTALKARTLIQREYTRILDRFEAVLSPVSQDTAPPLGESMSDPLSMYCNDQFTVSANLTGMPAMSFPCGFDTNGLPIGAQLLGKPFEENTLMTIASFYQQRTDFHLRRPYQKNGEDMK